MASKWSRTYRRVLKFVRRTRPHLTTLSVIVVIAISIILFRGVFTNDLKFIAFAEVVAWPLVVLGSVLTLRHPLRQLLEAIGQRANKISAFQIELELSDAPRLQPWSGPSLEEIRSPEPTSWTSDSSGQLFQQIMDASPSDYAIVDLGAGDNWLTTRLFIFSEMLRRMRGLKCIVFLKTQNGVERSFVGTARPEDVRWAIAYFIPWIEKAFIDSYHRHFAHDDAKTLSAGRCWIKSREGAVETYTATNLVRDFIENLTHRETALPDSADQTEWTKLDDSRWERAQWISETQLQAILDAKLERSWVYRNVTTARSDEVKAVLGCDGDFVAMLDDDKRFRSLINRRQLLDLLSRDFVADGS